MIGIVSSYYLLFKYFYSSLSLSLWMIRVNLFFFSSLLLFKGSSFIFITIKCCKMDGSYSFWQLGDELRGQTKVSEDHKWLWAASKLAEQTRLKGERMNNLDFTKSSLDARPREKFGFQEDNKFESFNFNMLNLDSKMNDTVNKSSLRSGIYNMNAVYGKNNANVVGNLPGTKYSGNDYVNKDLTNFITANNHVGENAGAVNAIDKRFKTLPATETLPRNEVLGGYIFVCNNDTMQEDLKRQLFGNCAFPLFTFSDLGHRMQE